MRKIQEILRTLELQEAILLDAIYDDAIVGVDIGGKRVIYNYDYLMEISLSRHDSVSAWKITEDLINRSSEKGSNAPVIMSPLTAGSVISDGVREIIEEKLDGVKYSRNLPLFEVMDSLDGVEVIMNLEKKFQLSIPDSLIGELRTPTAIEIYIENELRKNGTLQEKQ